MALVPEELFGAENPVLPNLRVQPYVGGIRPGQLAAITGAPELPHLTPLAFDEDADLWKVWDDSVAAEIYTITSDATPATNGTFTLSLDGETSAAIAFDATAAAVQAALEAMSNIAPGDVVAVQTARTDLGDASAVVTLTFGGQYAGMPVVLTADFSGLTGNTHVLANSQDGSGSETDQIDGLLWVPDSQGQATSASGEVLVQVLRRGQVHHDDVPLPTTSSQTQNGLTAALKAQRLRMLGIDVVGVQGVH